MMTLDAMATRGRWGAAMRLGTVDRLPFWPKLDAAYPRAQRAPFIEHIEHSLSELLHHCGIVATSAGVMPPLRPPETIKAVCDWVTCYGARV